MKIFGLSPHRAGAPWGHSQNHGEVIIRARSSAKARFVAAHADTALAHLAGGRWFETAPCAFRGPLLYRVIMDATGGMKKPGPPKLSGAWLARRPQPDDSALAGPATAERFLEPDAFKPSGPTCVDLPIRLCELSALSRSQGAVACTRLGKLTIAPLGAGYPDYRDKISVQETDPCR